MQGTVLAETEAFITRQREALRKHPAKAAVKSDQAAAA
jgi:hypothetical protein